MDPFTGGRPIGYHPEIILAGRRLNDQMGVYVARQMVKAMLKRRIQVDGARVLVLGLAFKENCPDVRNTRVVDVIRELAEYGASVDVSDPWVDPDQAEHEYGIRLVAEPAAGTYDGVILAVPHRDFLEWQPARLRALGREPHVLFDLKSKLPPDCSDLRL